MELCDGLRVVDVPSGNEGHTIKGVLATKVFWQGEIIFEELPIAASQHFFSRKVVTACEGCMKTLGSLRTRLGKILQANVGGPQFLETDFPNFASNPALDDSLFSRDGMRYEQIIECACSSSCRAVFCSDNCLNERGVLHRTLSQGDWKELYRYAAKKHENIKVALQLLVCPRRDEVPGLWNPRWSEIENISPEWVALRKTIVDESYAMLRQGWCYDIPFPTIEQWDRTLGIVDFTSKDLRSTNQANIQLMKAKRHEHLRDFFLDNGLFWAHISTIGREAEAFFANTEEHTHPEQDKETFCPEEARTAWCTNGNILNDIQGLGVYRHIAFMNHSCYPNVDMSTLQSDKVQGRVSRRIETGEAVCMSYIDEDATLASRQRSLYVDYIFHCRCVKCRVQGAAHILAHGTVVTSKHHEALIPLITYLKEYAARNQVLLEDACADIVECSPVTSWAEVSALQGSTDVSDTQAGA